MKARSCFLVSSVFCLLTAPRVAAAQQGFAAGADLIQLLHSSGLDSAECYRVRDVSLVKEDLRLYFNDGYLIFAKPVRGERWAAVFSGDVEGGDGEVLLLPPYRGEWQSLAKFTQAPNLDEHFSSGLLVFTDGSGDALLDQITRGNRSGKSEKEGALLAGQWN